MTLKQMKQKQSEAAHLKTVIERIHGCTVHYLKRVPVTEEFEGQTAWKGIVHVFSLTGYQQSDTDTCYAWCSAVESSDKLR